MLAEDVQKNIRTYSKKFRDLTIQMVAQNSNIAYKKMMQESTGRSSSLKIDPNEGAVNVMDSQGNIIFNINTGHAVIRDLAFMCGMIVTANNYLKTSMPFITDAPSSDLDGPNLKNMITAVTKGFDECIIINDS